MKNGDYELIKAPSDYPGKKYRGKYCSKHVYVYWKTYGILPKDNEIIHHKDENKHNNDPNNLELLTRKEHTRTHTLERGRQLVELKCPLCEKIFIKPKNNTFLQNKGSYTCCSKKCADKMLSLSKGEREKRIVGNVIREFVDNKSKYDL